VSANQFILFLLFEIERCLQEELGIIDITHLHTHQGTVILKINPLLNENDYQYNLKMKLSPLFIFEGSLHESSRLPL